MRRGKHRCKPDSSLIGFSIGPISLKEAQALFTVQGVTTLILNTTEKVTLSFVPRTKSGKVARVDGVPVWTNSNDLAATLVVATDGLTVMS